ncbi:MAG TPA: MFS transporter [Caulobacteraceae bacterium]|jgi:MFS family permease|nr:MFS transporter [Caulobacteraceae bacterium]
MDGRPLTARRAIHPIVFLALYLPFGAVSGYLSVALAYQLRKSGVSTAEIAGLIAFALTPHVFKVLWAPLVDTTFKPKSWYLAGSVVVAASVALSGTLPLGPASLAWLGPLVFLLNLATTFVGMAAEILMAHSTTPGQKGQAGGWSQAGNVGGAGLGGGAGLWMATHLAAPWIAGAVLGAAILACSLALLALPEPSMDHRRPRYLESLWSVARDVWSIARSRAGFLALLIFILPLGTGTASNLFASISGDWKASADLVAVVAGVAGGVFATFGAVAGGYVCDRLERKGAYALFSAVQGLCALGMGLAPHTPSMFIVFALAYAATNGMAYAGFSALTLETIGKGAAATKYNLLACFSNAPILYVALIEGQVQTRWGSTAMLAGEAVLAGIGLAIFGAVALLTRRRGVQSAVNATSGA